MEFHRLSSFLHDGVPHPLWRMGGGSLGLHARHYQRSIMSGGIFSHAPLGKLCGQYTFTNYDEIKTSRRLFLLNIFKKCIQLDRDHVKFDARNKRKSFISLFKAAIDIM